MVQDEPEVNADSSEGAVEDDVGAERDANVESDEKEGFGEDLMICQVTYVYHLDYVFGSGIISEF